MIDIHSHILPEIDDGPPDWETSIEMCRIAAADGITTMVASPHMLDGMYNVKREVIIASVDKLKDRLHQENINLTVLPGADIHVDIDFVDLLRQGKLVTINETGKYVLIEFPHDGLPPSVDKLLFSIQVAGVTPIITHPERHHLVQNRLNLVSQWAEAGNLIQITAASLTGEMGKPARECSLKLLKMGLVHLIASDAHSATWRSPGLSKARKIVTEILSEESADEIFIIRPQMIIDGENFEIPSPNENALETKKTFFNWKCLLPWKRRTLIEHQK